jgi:hypothetical protein
LHISLSSTFLASLWAQFFIAYTKHPTPSHIVFLSSLSSYELDAFKILFVFGFCLHVCTTDVPSLCDQCPSLCDQCPSKLTCCWQWQSMLLLLSQVFQSLEL